MPKQETNKCLQNMECFHWKITVFLYFLPIFYDHPLLANISFLLLMFSCSFSHSPAHWVETNLLAAVCWKSEAKQSLHIQHLASQDIIHQNRLSAARLPFLILLMGASCSHFLPPFLPSSFSLSFVMILAKNCHLINSLFILVWNCFPGSDQLRQNTSPCWVICNICE